MRVALSFLIRLHARLAISLAAIGIVYCSLAIAAQDEGEVASPIAPQRYDELDDLPQTVFASTNGQEPKENPVALPVAGKPQEKTNTQAAVQPKSSRVPASQTKSEGKRSNKKKTSGKKISAKKAMPKSLVAKKMKTSPRRPAGLPKVLPKKKKVQNL